MPAHSHSWGGTSNAIGGNNEQIWKVGTPGQYQTSATGGGRPHNNMQPYVAINYVIKY